MAYNIENYEAEAMYQSTWTTAKNMSVGGTLASGALTVTGAISATANVTSTSGYVSLSATTTTANGFQNPGIAMGMGLFGIYFGSGLPTVSAPQGSLYLRTDGSSTTNRIYVNSTVTSGTSWVGVTTQS